jgi:PEP-CTERM motif
MWGIDNFVVSSTPIPEPATGALLGLGLLLLAARKRRRPRACL